MTICGGLYGLRYLFDGKAVQHRINPLQAFHESLQPLLGIRGDVVRHLVATLRIRSTSTSARPSFAGLHMMGRPNYRTMACCIVTRLLLARAAAPANWRYWPSRAKSVWPSPCPGNRSVRPPLHPALYRHGSPIRRSRRFPRSPPRSRTRCWLQYQRRSAVSWSRRLAQRGRHPASRVSAPYLRCRNHVAFRARYL